MTEPKWKLVPVEPTAEMTAASEAVLANWRRSLSPDERMIHSKIVAGRQRTYMDPKEKHRARYRAMLAASPASPLDREKVAAIIETAADRIVSGMLSAFATIRDAEIETAKTEAVSAILAMMEAG